MHPDFPLTTMVNYNATKSIIYLQRPLLRNSMIHEIVMETAFDARASFL